MSGIAVEMVRFRLIAGVSEDELLAASNIMMKELGSLDGFIDRELLKNDDGSWMDMLHWEDMDSALRATEEALKLPLCLEYFKLIDEPTMEMSHYSLMQHFGV